MKKELVALAVLDNNILNYILENSNKSIRQLEKETGIGRNKISKILKEHNINKDNRLTKEEQEFILRNKHMSYNDLAQILNRKAVTVKGFLNRNKIYKQEEFNPNLEDFLNLYQDMTMVDLSKHYNVCKDTLLKFIDKNNIKRKSYISQELKLQKQKDKLERTPNYSYFENINTPQKAYFLGLIASDGSINNKKERYPNSQNTMQISLKGEDVEILNILHEELNTHRQCSYYKPKDVYSFQIASDKICNDLNNYGIVYNKTWSLNIKNIPHEYIPAFLLGYFDGDGSISKNITTISNTDVTICGTESSMNSISKLLNDIDLKYSIIEDARHSKYKGNFFKIVFKNTTEKYLFLKTIYSSNCKSLSRKRILSKKLMNMIEHNITNRKENIDAIKQWELRTSGSK